MFCKRKPILLLLLLLALSSLPSPSLAWTKRIDAHGKTIIAYYASWKWYDRSGLAKPSNLDHSKVTRYNFAFFQINSSGDIWGTDSWADPNTLFGPFDWSGSGTEYCSWDTPPRPPRATIGSILLPRSCEPRNSEALRDHPSCGI